MADWPWDAAAQLYEGLCSSGGSGAGRWWDVVVLLAADEPQRRFFEAMLECRRSTRLLPMRAGCEYLVVVARCPGGAVTADAAALLADPLRDISRVLRERGGTGVFDDKRVLVIDGAGYATRIPNLNIKGTLFAPLPGGLGVPGMPVGTVFDYKMIEHAPVAQSCGNGVYVASGDLCGRYDAAAQAERLEQDTMPVQLEDRELRACLLDSRTSTELAVHSLGEYAGRFGAAHMLCSAAAAPRRRISCSSVDSACSVDASASLLASTLSSTLVDADAVVEFSRIMGAAARPHHIAKGAIVSSIFYHPALPSPDDATAPTLPPLVVPPTVLVMSCATSVGVATLFFALGDDLECVPPRCVFSRQIPCRYLG